MDKNKIIISKKTGDIASLGLTLGKKITEEEINKTVNEAAEGIVNSRH